MRNSGKGMRREDKWKTNLVLIGMPAVGKSTIGVILAKELGYRFLDSDLLIQEREGKLLCEILDQQGVTAFLKIEEEVNASIQAERTIIATGGSAVYGKKAMEHFQDIGRVIYLKIAFHEISERLGNIKGRGVVLREGQSLLDLYEERSRLYEAYADMIIDETGKGIEETLSELLQVLS